MSACFTTSNLIQASDPSLHMPNSMPFAPLSFDCLKMNCGGSVEDSNYHWTVLRTISLQTQSRNISCVTFALAVVKGELYPKNELLLNNDNDNDN